MEEKQKKEIDDLIVTYLSGEADNVTKDELITWISASVENENYFIRQQEVWFSAIEPKSVTLYDKDKAFELFRKRVRRRLKEQNFWERKFRIPSYWRYAAVFAVIFLAASLSYWRGVVSIKKNFSDIIVEAPLGSRSKLYLPDGTLVWLNAGSRISYSQGFGVDNRKVKLEGEGYFEVKRKEESPFSVQTKALQVQVLGTIFNFRDYPEDREVIVSLLKGKVALNNQLRAEEKVTLSPNERVVLNKTTGIMKKESVMAANASTWTDGYLFFDEELLPDIAKELERSYNVKITIANESLKNFRFYGNFVQREQSIQEVLEALASTKKIRYKIKERNITIY